jgi:hypothetical protein
VIIRGRTKEDFILKKYIIIAIPILMIAIFILIMVSDNFLKKPMGDDDDVPAFIQSIIQDIISDKWDSAEDKTEQLSKAWRKVVNRIQFSAEKDEINEFDMNLARLRGAIIAKDKSNAIMELTEAKEHWDNVGR